MGSVNMIWNEKCSGTRKDGQPCNSNATQWGNNGLVYCHHHVGQGGKINYWSINHPDYYQKKLPKSSTQNDWNWFGFYVKIIAIVWCILFIPILVLLISVLEWIVNWNGLYPMVLIITIFSWGFLIVDWWIGRK